MANYDVLARRSQRLTLFCILVLLILIVIKVFVVPNSPRALSVNIILWVISSLPLLIFVPGIRRRAINSFAWLSFVSLLYFLYGVLAVFAPSKRWFDVLYLVLSVTLFMSAMLSVRFIARARRASLAE